MSAQRELSLYPRLERPAARRLMQERADLQLSELYELGSHTHPEAAPAPTGGHPVSDSQIREVQERIRMVAEKAGYPESLKGRTQDFDRPCGGELYRTMGIVPADAAAEQVWTFLTLVVVPEIGPWRFTDRSDERILGRPRNVLRRLWWRAWALGADLEYAPDGCRPLGEDEVVQILERPSLGGNQRVAGALRNALWRAESKGLPVARSEIMRQMTRRVRAAKSHILLDALSDAQLEELIDACAAASIQALIGSGWPDPDIVSGAG